MFNISGAGDLKMISAIKILRNNLPLNHLLFADHLLLMLKAAKRNVLNCKKIVATFFLIILKVEKPIKE